MIFLMINTKYPQVGLLLRRFYRYKSLMNSVQKKVKGKSNSIMYKGSILNKVSFDIIGHHNSINIKKGAILNNVTFFIRGDNHRVIIEEHCVFSRGGTIWFEHDNGLLEIGRNSSLEDVHIAVTEPHSTVKIGANCMFAYDIDIRTGDSHSIIDEKTGERINYAKDITIGDHVWLASHCRILKGVNIEKNSVVGTNAVVTKSFDEAGVILAGNPAKIVKQNITWERENICNG